MTRVVDWCMAHRRRVVVASVAVAIVATALAGLVGNHYATNFNLPGTESQHAADLLKREFRAQSGDVDTIVFHVSRDTIDAPAVRATIAPMLARVATYPHVAGVVSPYDPRGVAQMSSNRTSAFATINYDKQANLLQNSTGKRLLDQVKAVHVPHLRIAAGGQVVETPRTSTWVRPRRSERLRRSSSCCSRSLAHGGRNATDHLRTRVARARGVADTAARDPVALRRPRGPPAPRSPELAAARRSKWRRWSEVVQARPWPTAIASSAVIVALLIPAFALRLDSGDAGNDWCSPRTAARTPGRPASPRRGRTERSGAALPRPRRGLRSPWRAAPAARLPGHDREALPRATDALPPLEHSAGTPVLVGGFTAGQIDFSRVLSSKLPLFIGLVVLLSALSLFVTFRSLVIPAQSALMNLLSIGGALGATVAVFQWRLARKRARCPARPDRAVDTCADLRGCVRTVDGLRSVPGFPRA